VHPILFRFGPLTIYSYGACVAAAFLAAIVTAAARARRCGWGADLVYDVSIPILVGALAGSRLLYVAENPSEFIAAPWEAFMLWRGGLSYYGGLVGAILAAVIFLRVRRISVAECFDILTPSVALGHAIGRVGCFLNGCCFGAPCALPLAVVFPPGSVAHSFYCGEAGAIPQGAVWTPPLHPVQVYESLIELGIFLALAAYFPRRKARGQIFWMYILMYGIARFALECLRADNPPVMVVGGRALSFPQVMSLAAAVLSLVVLLWMGARTAPAAGSMKARRARPST